MREVGSRHRVILSEAAVRDLEVIPKRVQVQIVKAIRERLCIAPMDYGKAMRRNYKGYRRLRVNDYRVIYTVDPEGDHDVTIHAIGNRKDVYE